MEMESTKSGENEEFDDYAANYEEELGKGLSVTGESQAFFAEKRLEWLKRRLDRRSFVPGTVLDFGCGTGGSIPFFFEHLGVTRALGVDPSAKSLEVARVDWASLNAEFYQPEELGAVDASVDLAFCNGVFHHIPVEERAAAVRLVYERLRPGGLFAFWENNAWNPAVRYIMSRVSFDADAILVWPAGARRLLRDAGFEIESTDFIFVFPRSLGALRALEPSFCKLPLGGQYLVLARKPG